MFKHFIRWLGFHVHVWSEWVEHSEIKKFHPIHKEYSVVVGIIQTRHCVDCMRKQFIYHKMNIPRGYI